MQTKNYSIHPILCMCLCDDKVFVGPKELEPMWRGIRLETAQSLYKLMAALTDNDSHINQLHRRESLFQYQVLCASAQPFTKRRVAIDCRTRSKTYRKVTRAPARRLYTISEANSGHSLRCTYQTKRFYMAKRAKRDYQTDWSLKISEKSDSCWLAIKQNSVAFHRN